MQYTLLGIDRMVTPPHAMPFTGIDHKAGRNSERTQGMIEFKTLCRRTFDVIGTDIDEGRGLHLLDEGNRRGMGVDSRIVIDRGAKERRHPASMPFWP